ncbi:MAG: enoyl-CoA hydratase/isomerase family protein [Bacteroidales bacterium]|nr:MAG: enoyl-CoA hydratase/isomerase family protein [Bacteroidales bacterium]
MQDYKTILYEYKDQIAIIWLNRPQIRNAFNETMISELIDCFLDVNEKENVRVVLLKGKGKSFCAGADLNWMRDVTKYSYEENYQESYRLSKCFYSIYTCRKPTIAVVHGAAIGGANGLLAACDMAYCDHETVFSLSEVKIGVVPACISPYILKRMGEFPARELMLTGRRIKGTEAEKLRLVNQSLPMKDLENHVNAVIELLKTSGPGAISHCKNLIFDVSNKITLEKALEYTARMIAEIRASSEGQEGMKAFLEKRPPDWVNQ